jgi:hypothetical protein
LPDEAGIGLSPLRMKRENSSTALPRTTRIHFSRAYIVNHALPVHPASMEILLDQFEENGFKGKKSRQMGLGRLRE